MRSPETSHGGVPSPMGERLVRLAQAFAREYGRPLAARAGCEPPLPGILGQALLDALAQQLGLDALAWARPGRDPVVAGRGCGLRSFVQSVEWPLLAAVDPGHWTNLRPDAHPRSGRMRGLACHGFMARPAGGAEGVLVGLSTGPAHGPRARWVRLAEWVAVSFQAEEEQFMARVQERERKLGRQTAALTHDLRNQLNLASMQLERLRAEVQVPMRGGGADGEDHAQGLADLSRSLGSARDLCAGTVVGQGALERRRVALRHSLLTQARGARDLAPRGERVRVLVRCPADLVVIGHPSHLDRLVKNLILNAIEASPAGGEVRLAARAEGPEIRLDVIDQGRGMDRAAQAEWMHPGRSGSGGTGYGSASLQECLDELGGRLEVSSAPGKGTRVSVYLPCAPPRQESLLLLVDPDPRRRARRSKWLEKQGQAVAQAGSLEDARTWLGEASVEGVLVARGLHGDGLASFRSAARREGLEVSLVGGQADEFQRVVKTARRRSRIRGN